ncbi:MAG: PIG-L family deacetylase [Planctomycetes bacterium]|nr:PIG-L family deacetylase [Planctomycetota bacterium]
MSKPLRILVIFPHPDDSVFFAAGTLARWAAEGHHITSVCVTSGNLGTMRPDETPEQVAVSRAAQQRAADAVLGVHETVTLGYPDGGFIDAAALREELVGVVRRYRPDRLLTLDPWVRYEVHPDHAVAARMTCEAGAFAAFPLLHPDQVAAGLAPHSPSEVWLMGTLGRRPNCYVDIASTLDTKVAAVLEFDSTLAILAAMFAPEIDPANVSPTEREVLAGHADTWVRSMAARVGKVADLAAAEAFFVERCLPGHFDNMDRMIDEMLGEPDPPPRIV